MDDTDDHKTKRPLSLSESSSRDDDDREPLTRKDSNVSNISNLSNTSDLTDSSLEAMSRKTSRTSASELNDDKDTSRTPKSTVEEDDISSPDV